MDHEIYIALADLNERLTKVEKDFAELVSELKKGIKK